MLNILASLIVLFATATAATEFIMCTPQFCNMISCDPVTPESCQAQNKDFRPNSTFCRCCSQCIDYLSEGDPCDIQPFFPYNALGLPFPLLKHCATELFCLNHKCTSKVHMNSNILKQ